MIYSLKYIFCFLIVQKVTVLVGDPIDFSALFQRKAAENLSEVHTCAGTIMYNNVTFHQI